MPACLDESDAIAISHGYPIHYCDCVGLQVEYRGFPEVAYCTACRRRCPDEEAIYLALRNTEPIAKLGIRWFKKPRSNRTAKIRPALMEIQGQPGVKTLIDEYGMNALWSVVKRLLKSGVFGSVSNAKSRFPSLACDVEDPDPIEEAMIEKATEESPERSDWELLAPEDAPVEASAPASEETPEEDKALPEEELSTTEAYPTEAYEDAPKATEPSEVEEAPENCVQEKQDTIYLPFSSQHKLMVHLQEVLEGACFAYGQRNLPELLRERGWNCVEAVALGTWMDQFTRIRHTFDTEPGRDLLESIAEIQDTVVKRTPIDSSRLKTVLDDIVKLLNVLEVNEYGDIVKKIRLEIGKVIEGLGREEQEVEDRHEKKLKRIYEERVKLIRLEEMVREEKERNMKECQKSVNVGGSHTAVC